nr:beta-propeller fold lactonase family protein [Bacillus subtilis]
MPDDFTDKSEGSGIHVREEGGFVYVGKGGDESMGVFEVNEY